MRKLLLLLFFVSLTSLNAQTKSAFNTNDYVSFGDKFQPKKVLTEKQMLKKYKSLKKGDSVKVVFQSNIKSVCKNVRITFQSFPCPKKPLFGPRTNG